MSGSKSTLDSVAEGVILVFLGLLAMVFTGSIFMLFFAPSVGYYLWWTHDKTKELERRLSNIEKPPQEPTPDQP